MLQDPRKPSADMQSSGSDQTDDLERGVGNPREMQCNKPYRWAQCGEPYKTELDTLGSLWIEGVLSDKELALEAVQLLSNLEWVRRPSESPALVQTDDAITQAKILTEAMLASTVHPDMTPELRREALEFMRSEFGGVRRKEY